MLVFYFAGAVWAAGSAIASGLFVPMLLIGSCIGRIAGLMAVDFAAAGGHGSPGCVSPLTNAWRSQVVETHVARPDAKFWQGSGTHSSLWGTQHLQTGDDCLCKLLGCSPDCTQCW